MSCVDHILKNYCWLAFNEMKNEVKTKINWVRIQFYK